MPKIGSITMRSEDEIEMSLRFHSDAVISFARPDARTPRWLVHLRSHTKPLALTTREVEVLIVGLREMQIVTDDERAGRAHAPEPETVTLTFNDGKPANR